MRETRILTICLLFSIAYTKSIQTVTDSEIQDLTEELLNLDVVNNASEYISVDLSAHRNDFDHVSSKNLLTISPQAFDRSTITALLRLQDNYHPDARVTEHFQPEEETEIDSFVDAIFETPIMQRTQEFLKTKEMPNGKSEFRKIWFTLYKRINTDAENSSSGFEHVFLGEIIKNGIGGLHNWVVFGLEELVNRLTYLGDRDHLDMGPKGFIIEHSLQWKTKYKPISTIFVGTSPELEMSIYTICFYSRPNGKCRISLNKWKFNIESRIFTTPSGTVVGTTYPDLITKELP